MPSDPIRNNNHRFYGWPEWVNFSSISNSESVAGLAGSIASVFSKHIITACRTFRFPSLLIVVTIFIIRETKFVVSMPIPRNTELCAGPEDCLTIYDSLRRSQKYFNEHKKWQYFVPRSFTNSLRANFIDYDNVIICSNDNLATDNGQVGTMICSKVSHYSHFLRRLQLEIFSSDSFCHYFVLILPFR